MSEVWAERLYREGYRPRLVRLEEDGVRVGARMYPLSRGTRVSLSMMHQVVVLRSGNGRRVYLRFQNVAVAREWVDLLLMRVPDSVFFTGMEQEAMPRAELIPHSDSADEEGAAPPVPSPSQQRQNHNQRAPIARERVPQLSTKEILWGRIIATVSLLLFVAWHWIPSWEKGNNEAEAQELLPQLQSGLQFLVYCVLFRRIPAFSFVFELTLSGQMVTPIWHMVTRLVFNQGFIQKYWMAILPASIAISVSFVSMMVHSTPIAGVFWFFFQKRELVYAMLSLVFALDALLIIISTGFASVPFSIGYGWLALLFSLFVFARQKNMIIAQFVPLVSGSILIALSALAANGERNARQLSFSILLILKQTENRDILTLLDEQILSISSPILGLTSLIFLLIGFHALNLFPFATVKNFLLNGGTRMVFGSLIMAASLLLITKESSNDQSAPSVFAFGCLLLPFGFALVYFGEGFFKPLVGLFERYYDQIRLILFRDFLVSFLLGVAFWKSLCVTQFALPWFEPKLEYSLLGIPINILSVLFPLKVAFFLFEGSTSALHENQQQNVDNRTLSQQKWTRQKYRRRFVLYPFLIVRILLACQLVAVLFISVDKNSRDISEYQDPSIIGQLWSFFWIWINISVSYFSFILFEARVEFDEFLYEFGIPLPPIEGVDLLSPAQIVQFTSLISGAYQIGVLVKNAKAGNVLIASIDVVLFFITIIPGIMQLQSMRQAVRAIINRGINIQNYFQQHPKVFFCIFGCIIPGLYLIHLLDVGPVVIGANMVLYGIVELAREFQWDSLARTTLTCINAQRFLLRFIRAGFALMFSLVFLDAFQKTYSVAFLLASYTAFVGTLFLVGDALGVNQMKSLAFQMYLHLDLYSIYACDLIVFKSGLWKKLSEIFSSLGSMLIAISNGITAIMNEGLIPVFNAFKRGFLAIWNNPGFGICFSASMFVALYFIDQTHLDIAALEMLTSMANQVVSSWLQFYSMMKNSGDLIRVLTDKVEPVGPLKWATVVNQVQSISDAALLLHVRSFAWVFYLIPVFISKSSDPASLRIKPIVIPLTLLLGCFGFAPSMFGYVFVIICAYGLIFMILLFVDTRERHLVETQYQAWRQQRHAGERQAGQAAPEIPLAPFFVPATALAPNRDDDCTVCLEANTLAQSDNPATRSVALLRCNHVFHEACISEWIAQTERSRRRCPVCREPVDPPNAVLEAMF